MRFTPESCPVRARTPANFWGPPWTGAEHKPLSCEEDALRRRIADGSLSKTRARAVLTGIDGATPWRTRADFIEALAAISALFPEDMSRKVTGANRTLYQILHAAAAAPRVEWYFNCMRIRHRMPIRMQSLLASGTSSNESLHREVTFSPWGSALLVGSKRVRQERAP